MQVLTFDRGGVSWHANHISVSNGVEFTLSKLKEEAPEQHSHVDLFMLVSML